MKTVSKANTKQCTLGLKQQAKQKLLKTYFAYTHTTHTGKNKSKSYRFHLLLDGSYKAFKIQTKLGLEFEPAIEHLTDINRNQENNAKIVMTIA